MTIRWPCDALQAVNVSFDIAARSLAAPASVSGVTQVVSSDAGVWKATLGGVVVRNRDHVLAFRAIAALLEGRLGTILVPLCSAYQPKPANWRDLYDPIPHDDDAAFDDDALYAGSSIVVFCATAVPARAVSMTVKVVAAGDIQPGQHFSVEERLYRITAYDATSRTMTFRPPLREAVAAGTELNFDDPVCRMRLAGDDEMDLELQMRRRAEPSVNFIEAL